MQISSRPAFGCDRCPQVVNGLVEKGSSVKNANSYLDLNLTSGMLKGEKHETTVDRLTRAVQDMGETIAANINRNYR